MTALVPTTVQEASYVNLSVTYPVTGGTERPLKLVYIEATTTATSNTTDISTYVPGTSGIAGIVCESVDGAVAATASTWSTTTITWASHTGSGGNKSLWLVY